MTVTKKCETEYDHKKYMISVSSKGLPRYNIMIIVHGKTMYDLNEYQ
jgi:hypothetical protein